MPVVVALHLVAFAAGVGLVVVVLLSAVRSFVLPRSASDPVARVVFRGLRRVFDVPARRMGTYERVDSLMALYTPVALLLLVVAWLALVLAGYTLMFWALGGGEWPWQAGPRSWTDAFTLSGSSIFTLGFALAGDLPSRALIFSEAAIGLFLIALLISYLPTIYSAFSRREEAVTLLEIRAGSPPSAVTLLERIFRLHREQYLQEFFIEWERWFGVVEETHTSLGAVGLLRSVRSSRSWVTASGAVLDSAALIASAVEMRREAQEDLCIRAGYLALRHICDFFLVPYNPDPTADSPISVTREEFDAAYDHLAAAGVPLKPDRDQCWRDFAGWRCNYDEPLLAMAELTLAPFAPWSSDRCRGQLVRLRQKYGRPRKGSPVASVQPNAGGFQPGP